MNDNTEVKELLINLVEKINDLESKVNTSAGGKLSPPAQVSAEAEPPTIYQQIKTASELKMSRINWTNQEFSKTISEIETTIDWDLEKNHEQLAQIEIFCEENTIERYIGLMLKLMLLKGLTQNVASYIFGKSQTMAHRWMRKWCEREESPDGSSTEEDRTDTDTGTGEQDAVPEPTL